MVEGELFCLQHHSWNVAPSIESKVPIQGVPQYWMSKSVGAVHPELVRSSCKGLKFKPCAFGSIAVLYAESPPFCDGSPPVLQIDYLVWPVGYVKSFWKVHNAIGFLYDSMHERLVCFVHFLSFE